MPTSKDQTIVSFPNNQSPGKQKKISEDKFGKKVMDCGFNMVPSILLRGQKRLGLNPTQLAVLIQLLDHWWQPANPARPGQKSLANRLNLSKRQLQRVLKQLQDAGFVEVVSRHHGGHNGRQPNQYKLDGLVNKLKKLEPDFSKARQETKKTNSDVEKSGAKLKKKLGLD